MVATPSVSRAMPLSTPYTAAVPDAQSERIGVLDVLRGIALCGMFLVHFSDRSPDTGHGLDHAYQTFIDVFFANRFHAMFAILFGVGFAVQLRRADARGEALTARFLRRLLALAVFGFIAEGYFGFSILIQYAIWGLPLLLVRRWSTKALVVTLVLCAMSIGIYLVTRATYATVMGRAEQYEPGMKAERDQDRAINRGFRKQEESTDYRTVVSARIRQVAFSYSRPTRVIPASDFTMFLVGLLALRLGVFDDPRRHRRLITAMMIFGTVAWAAAQWVPPVLITIPPAWPLPIRTILGANRGFFFLWNYLAFTYVGAILLLVAHNPAWLRRLGAFGITGRMALTNYMLQVIILDVTFSNYGFGMRISSAYGLLAAVALFGVDVVLCRYWLSRYQYGPLEWLWRSATYAHWQPIVRAAPQS
jgi:uncharacterized protein